jgi:hypothetical protein
MKHETRTVEGQAGGAAVFLNSVSVLQSDSFAIFQAHTPWYRLVPTLLAVLIKGILSFRGGLTPRVVQECTVLKVF